MNEIGGEEWVRNATHWWEESEKASISGHGRQRRRARHCRCRDKVATTRTRRRRRLHATKLHAARGKWQTWQWRSFTLHTTASDAVGGRRQGLHAMDRCRGCSKRWAGGRHPGCRKCEGNGLPEGRGKVGVRRKVKMWEGEGKNERDIYDNYKLKVQN